MKRHASIIIGVALSVLIHAIAIWLTIERAPVITQEKLLGNSDRMAITLLSPNITATPQNPPPSSEANQALDRPVQTKRKTAKAVRKPVPEPAPVIPPVVTQAAPKEMRPPPADDMSSMLEAARKRRAQAQNPDNDSTAEEETERRNKVVMANIATSIGQANGRDKDGKGGVFQLRRVGSNSAEFLFRGWSAGLHRNSTQLVEVIKKSEPDIQTAIVRKMIEIIRENKHDEFVWESYRLGRDVTLSARPENGAQLERFLMQEFFSDYVPTRP